VGRSATTEFVFKRSRSATCTCTRKVARSAKEMFLRWGRRSSYHVSLTRQTFTHIHNVNAPSVAISVSCTLSHRVYPVLIIHWLAPSTLFWASSLEYLRITSTKQILGRHRLQNKNWTLLCDGRLKNTRPTGRKETRQGQVQTLSGRNY